MGCYSSHSPFLSSFLVKSNYSVICSSSCLENGISAHTECHKTVQRLKPIKAKILFISRFSLSQLRPTLELCNCLALCNDPICWSLFNTWIPHMLEKQLALAHAWKAVSLSQCYCNDQWFLTHVGLV